VYIDMKRELIFVHNPKTGGLSIKDMLRFSQKPNYRFIHMTVKESIEHIFQDSWLEYYSLSFVRNPWDRIVSLYEYQRSHTYGLFVNFDQVHFMAKSYIFSEWMDINIEKRISRYFGIPQTEWIYNVKEAYKFENFSEIRKYLAMKVDCLYSHFHNNKGSRMCYEEYFASEKHIQYIRETDQEVIDKYGYKF
jgi:Sulfotransferase family.